MKKDRHSISFLQSSYTFKVIDQSLPKFEFSTNETPKRLQGDSLSYNQKLRSESSKIMHKSIQLKLAQKPSELQIAESVCSTRSTKSSNAVKKKENPLDNELKIYSPQFQDSELFKQSLEKMKHLSPKDLISTCKKEHIKGKSLVENQEVHNSKSDFINTTQRYSKLFRKYKKYKAKEIQIAKAFQSKEQSILEQVIQLETNKKQQTYLI